MRTKLLILGLICLCLFACKKPEGLGPPIIEHFTATHLSGDTFTFSWRVTKAIIIIITPGIGGVSEVGSMEVEVFKTTVYTLIATNGFGDVARSCVVEPL